jgi:microcystin degradation protein MlrC
LILVLLFGVALSAPAVDFAERNVDAFTTVEKRVEQDATPTATATDNTPSSTSTASTTGTQGAATTATATATTTTITGTAVSNTSHSTFVATTVPSIDGSTGSGSDSQDGTKQKYTGGLPLQPEITPAWGVGGIILLLLGAALAFIGIRKQW